MNPLWLLLIVFAVWFLLMYFVLPKLGIPT
jgi:hypothetical protein